MKVEQWVELAASALAVDGLEFYWDFVPHGDSAALSRLRDFVREHGLEIPMLCCSPDFTKADRSERQAEVARQERAIEVTDELGGKFCRILSGQRRPDVSREDGLRMVVECFVGLLPVAEAHGVTLILENHYKDAAWEWPEFAQKTDVFLELLDAIPESASFGVNFDPSNALVAGEDPLVLLDAVKERVVTMHASDRYLEGGTLQDLQQIDADHHAGYASILRHGVVGKGLNDYEAIFSMLRSVGFNGWISIEDGQDPVVGIEHLRLSAEFLREKMVEHDLG